MIQGFNYSTIRDKEKRDQARKCAKQIRGLIQRSAEAVVEVGRLLNELRDAMTRRQWSAWLESEFQWTGTTASNYMRSASLFGGFEHLANLTPFAMYQLARRTTPKEAVKDALDIATSGELVTGKLARSIILKHRGAATAATREDRPPTFDEVRTSVDQFCSHLEHAAKELTTEQREAIADRMLKLARKVLALGGGKKRAAARRPAAQPAAREAA